MTIKQSLFISIVVLGITSLSFAQWNCNHYNFSWSGTRQGASDSSQHLSGQHNVTFDPYGQCAYSGTEIGGQCWGDDTVESANTPYESGELNGHSLVHKAVVNQQSGQSAGYIALSATEASGGGVASCTNNSCINESVGVTFPPISMTFSPQSAIWSYGNTATLNCPAIVLLCYPPIGGCGDKYIWNYISCLCQFVGGSPIVVQTIPGKDFKNGFSDPETNGVLFDLKNNGHPERYSWPKAGSGIGFLVYDHGTGWSDMNGSKLFGDYTKQQYTFSPGEPLPSKDGNKNKWTKGHGNGYIALWDYLKPENGGAYPTKLVVDKDSSIYHKLFVWIDKNRNGKVDPGELRSLPELGIKSISIAYSETHGYKDRWGNYFKYDAPLNVSDIEVRQTDAHGRQLDVQEVINNKTVPPRTADVYLQSKENKYH